MGTPLELFSQSERRRALFARGSPPEPAGSQSPPEWPGGPGRGLLLEGDLCGLCGSGDLCFRDLRQGFHGAAAAGPWPGAENSVSSESRQTVW